MMAARRLVVAISVVAGLSAPRPVVAQETEATSIVRAFAAAQNAGDVERAIALFAPDAVITNTRGQRLAPREFVEGNIRNRIQITFDSLQTVGNRVLTRATRSDAQLALLGFQQVGTNSEYHVEDGKIRSLTPYFPLDLLAEVERRCVTPQFRDVVVFNESCPRFLQLARTHTQAVLARNAPAQLPRTGDAGLPPVAALGVGLVLFGILVTRPARLPARIRLRRGPMG